MKQKNRKIILLISTIISILFTLFCIIAMNTGLLQLGGTENTAEISYASQMIFLSVCTIVNIMSIIFICKDITAHKKKIIVLNVIQLLLGTIINIISAIVNIIVIFPQKKEGKKKKELPDLQDITKYKWYIYLIIFVILFIICYTPIISLLFNPQTLISAIIGTVILYIIQIIALIIPMFNEIKRDFKIFKNNFKLYLSNMLPRFGLVFILYLIANLCVSSFVQDIPNNQAILNSLPIYITAFLAIVVGPLTEELMFRGFIKKFIKKDTLFVILSSLIFGLLHVLTADSLQQFVYIIPYSILGLAFSLNYVKTKNIASNIFLHSAWNTIVLIIMIITRV